MVFGSWGTVDAKAAKNASQREAGEQLRVVCVIECEELRRRQAVTTTDE